MSDPFPDLSDRAAAGLVGIVLCGPFLMAAGFMVLAAVLLKWVLS